MRRKHKQTRWMCYSSSILREEMYPPMSIKRLYDTAYSAAYSLSFRLRLQPYDVFISCLLSLAADFANMFYATKLVLGTSESDS